MMLVNCKKAVYTWILLFDFTISYRIFETTDGDLTVAFDHPIVARYMGFYPHTWHSNIFMSITAYGCAYPQDG